MKVRLLTVIVLTFIFSAICGQTDACPPNQPPTSVLTADPVHALVNMSVVLDGSDSHDSDGTIDKYEWDFTNDASYDYYETSDNHTDGEFDGKTTHAYDTSGTYTVKLRVTDNDGATAMDTCVVYVEVPPTPDPMTWAVPPYDVSGARTVTMVAAEASDVSTPVMYYFHCASGGGHDSGWQTSRVYTDINLSNGTYEYQVKAKDSRDNETGYSTPTASATVSMDYTTAPTGDFEPVTGELGNDLANFSVDPYTGSANYTIPIIIPPARGGSTPNISLSYSGGGNGWCGIGWSLGMGTIQRDTKKGVPVKMDSSGFVTPYQYDDDKGFVVSFRGVNCRLIKVGTNEYRAEVDKEFLKFEFNTTNNKWIVTDKSGNRYYFGSISTANSRMVNPDTGWSTTVRNKTFLWALDKIEDINGNLTWITYAKDSEQLYLSNIYYNGNSNDTDLDTQSEVPCRVQFTLESPDRADKSISYNSGFCVETKKRLDYITVTVDGQRVCKYYLDYIYSPSTSRSLLDKVTMKGSDDTTEAAMPYLDFDYQEQSFEFDTAIDWPNLSADSTYDWPYEDSPDYTHVTMLDINGDGLPDRVSQLYADPQSDGLIVELNTGSGFQSPAIYWGTLESPHTNWNRVGVTNSSGSTVTDVELLDINGDGFPDRVMHKASTPYDRFKVQINNKTGFSSMSDWTGVNSELGTTLYSWCSPHASDSTSCAFAALFDISGDGLPDRVMRGDSGWDYFKVQLNNGLSFGPLIDWENVQRQVAFTVWSSPFGTSEFAGGATIATMLDINGDGLTDRVVCYKDSYDTVFAVQFNMGYRFADEVYWGPLVYPSGTNWFYPRVPDGDAGDTGADLFDINGDGLPDRVMRGNLYWGDDYARFYVQLNTGSGFETSGGSGVKREWTINWASADSSKKNLVQYNRPHSSFTSVQTCTTATMIDINGDGLPDRLHEDWNGSNVFKVQLNKGPFPDLLEKVTGSLRGSIAVTYKSSTSMTKHKDNAGINQLSFPVNVVDTVTVNDGFNNQLATATYDYSRGMYDSVTREFRGFGKVEVKDHYNTKTIHYYHQGGGYDETSLGEFHDASSIAKKGMSFRTEVRDSGGNLYKVTVNKIDETAVTSGIGPDAGRAQYFPYVAKTIYMDYEGTGSYRAKAKEYSYDTAKGNLIKETDWGEVSSVVFNSTDHQFDDDDTGDNVYVHTAYKSFTNADIIDKIDWTKITLNSNPVETPEPSYDFKKSVYTYDDSDNCGYSGDRGNVTAEQRWLNIKDGEPVTNYYVSKAYWYDLLGNQRVTIDETGISTTVEYDSDYQTFPVRMVRGTGDINPPTSGTDPYKFTSETNKFITQTEYDPKSGNILTSTDVTGIDTDYTYDKLYRLTDVHKATVPGGAANLWLTKIEYNLGGFTSAPIKSQNYIRQRFANYDVYIYNDGLGRVVQARTKAETGAAGEYRVECAFYDRRGNESFKTLPFFSTGSAYTIETSRPGITTEYDGIGRIWRVTPPAGDAGSPTGPVTTAYKDGTNLWVNVITDAKSKVKKQHFDARGNVIELEEIMTVPSSYTVKTQFQYDEIGRLITIKNDTDIKAETDDYLITYDYDSLDRKIAMDDPDMGYWTYDYDDAGRPTKQVDGKDQIVALSYNDEIGRLKEKKTYSSESDYPSNPASTTTYTYDTSDDSAYTVYKGLLYKMGDSHGWQANGYDSCGRLVKTTRYLNRLNRDFTTVTAYDDAERTVELTYPRGFAVVRYSYDSAGHLSTIDSPYFRLRQSDGTSIDSSETFYQAATFNALEQLEGVDYGNAVKTRYEFYSNSKRRKRIHTYRGDPETGTQLQDLSYTFDEVANIKSITDAAFTTGEASSTFSNIQYDDLDRLTQLTYVVQGATDFSYDFLGNITFSDESGGSNYTYGSSKPHAVTSAYSTTYGYDDCGNMTTRGSRSLTYDEENRLVSVLGVGATVQFRYDGTGQRLYKEKAGDVVNIWMGNIYEERDSMAFCHILADDGMVATFLAENVGNPTPPVNSLFYYYHNDHLGSSSVMTDRSGSLVKHYGYRAYGNERYNNPTAAYDVSKRFTSQILDYDIDLYYYGARYYDAKLGRFVQADPVIPDDPTQNSQALSRYSYTFNNPLKFTDPSGNEPEDIEKKKDETSEKTRQDTNKVARSPNSNDNDSNVVYRGSNIDGLGVPDGRYSGSGDRNLSRSNRYPNGRYATQDAAASAAMSRYNPRSIRANKEFAGWIRKNRDGTYSFKRPTRGGLRGVMTGRKPRNATAYYHTHGRDDPRYKSEEFSDADRDVAKYHGVDGYVGTPRGKQRKYDHETGGESELNLQSSPGPIIGRRHKDPLQHQPQHRRRR